MAQSYLLVRQGGAGLLFNHLSLRTGKKSTLATASLNLGCFSGLFGDSTPSDALVDRITHNAYLEYLNGDSY
jgi:DNA replication protein DnaC